MGFVILLYSRSQRKRREKANGVDGGRGKWEIVRNEIVADSLIWMIV